LKSQVFFLKKKGHEIRTMLFCQENQSRSIILEIYFIFTSLFCVLVIMFIQSCCFCTSFFFLVIFLKSEFVKKKERKKGQATKRSEYKSNNKKKSTRNIVTKNRTSQQKVLALFFLDLTYSFVCTLYFFFNDKKNRLLFDVLLINTSREFTPLNIQFRFIL
jgi:hypothetical protein